jgi:hypothetical protein
MKGGDDENGGRKYGLKMRIITKYGPKMCKNGQKWHMKVGGKKGFRHDIFPLENVFLMVALRNMRCPWKLEMNANKSPISIDDEGKYGRHGKGGNEVNNMSGGQIDDEKH